MATAIRRLQASGLGPKARFFVASPERARRLAASLAFSLAPFDFGRCVRAVIKPSDTEESTHDR
jgi:hypothetical protein